MLTFKLSFDLSPEEQSRRLHAGSACFTLGFVPPHASLLGVQTSTCGRCGSLLLDEPGPEALALLLTLACWRQQPGRSVRLHLQAFLGPSDFVLLAELLEVLGATAADF